MGDERLPYSLIKSKLSEGVPNAQGSTSQVHHIGDHLVVKAGAIIPSLKEYMLATTLNSATKHEFRHSSPSYTYLNLKTAKDLDLPSDRDQKLFIIMKRGVSSKHWLNAPMSRETRVKAAENLLRDVCYSLFLLHSMGYVHGDVKPPNIILLGLLSPPTKERPRKEIWKLIDLNSARSQNNVTVKNSATLSYVSPEEVQLGIYTSASDMWALGMVLLEFLGYRDHLAPTNAEQLKAWMFSFKDQLETPYSEVSKLLKGTGELELNIRALVSFESKKRPKCDADSYKRMMKDFSKFTELSNFGCVPASVAITLSKMKDDIQKSTTHFSALLYLLAFAYRDIKFPTTKTGILQLLVMCHHLSFNRLSKSQLVGPDPAVVFNLCLDQGLTIPVSHLPRLPEDLCHRLSVLWDIDSMMVIDLFLRLCVQKTPEEFASACWGSPEIQHCC